MEIQGWYYLHENKELIYKNGSDSIIDIRDSDLCLAAWAWDGERATAWSLLVEAWSLGANNSRIKELAKKWNCSDEDVTNYAYYIGIKLGIDGNQHMAAKRNFINIQESPVGFGETYLEAMAALCKELGYKGGKMNWHKTFIDLLKIQNEETTEAADTVPGDNG